MVADPPPAPPALPLEAEEFLTWLLAERGRSPNTLAAYRRDLRAYCGWLAEQAMPLDGVAEHDINRYVAHLRNLGRAPSSVARALVAVRALHRFLAEEGHREGDPAAVVEVPRVPRGLPKALTETEVEQLLAQVAGDEPPARRDRAILEVLYGTGVRISELVGLSLGDLDLEGGLMRVYGKGAKERVVPLGRFARAALEAWLGEGGRERLLPQRWSRRTDADAVFLNQRGARLSRQGAWGIVRRYGAAAGLGARLTPHVLRHSCATHMLDHGADIRAVQELLGHASLSTTQVYTLVSTERLRAVYESAHPRARLEARD
ncbi:site-specific tyrosine recombinase XerD [Rhabdothermincola sediminis]|uniref:site-specific tyrosine recombinase XerD n=1 Tax=Rhabdothermincola sediminis TaxID=2751370 RepID=UPI001AA08BAF|nr:site-specific tyrosine recombinase XerD [Rhabdothermincola sediminis]